MEELLKEKETVEAKLEEIQNMIKELYDEEKKACDQLYIRRDQLLFKQSATEAEKQELSKIIKKINEIRNIYIEKQEDMYKKEKVLMDRVIELEKKIRSIQPPIISNGIIELKKIDSGISGRYDIYLCSTDINVGNIEYRSYHCSDYIADIGCFIEKEYRGNGYFKQALELLSELLARYKIPDFWISARKSNLPSIKTIEKFGGILKTPEDADYVLYEIKTKTKDKESEISIDDYIEMSKSMKTISDGSSDAYLFDDYVLIKYVEDAFYERDARYGEEAVLKFANELNVNGVNTPAHLAIKRESTPGQNICWVLQERAKGISFINYTTRVNNPTEQLQKQEELLNIPDEHYQKAILDLIQLSIVGIELKPKNIFYSKEKGFTFIDLLYRQYYDDEINVHKLFSLIDFIYEYSEIESFSDVASEEEIRTSQNISIKIIIKILNNLEKALPEFAQYKRDILRSKDISELEKISANGYDIGDLRLTEDEQKLFDDNIDKVVNNCMDKIQSGRYELWQIYSNEIRFGLDNMMLSSNWLYHKDNTKHKEEYESLSEYYLDCQEELENKVIEMFNQQLLNLESYDDDVIKAQQELQEILEEKRK